MALIQIAAMTFEECALDFGLDTFGHHRQIERVSHHHDGAHEGALLGTDADVFHECLVDLQHVDGQSLQAAKRLVSGSEVVNRDANAVFA